MNNLCLKSLIESAEGPATTKQKFRLNASPKFENLLFKFPKFIDNAIFIVAGSFI